MHHMNALSNPIPVITNQKMVDENPVTQDAGPVLVETVKRRKTRVKRFSSDMKRGNVNSHHMHTGLNVIAEVCKEHNCGWNNKTPP